MFTLRSNDGNSEISLELLGRTEYAHELGFESIFRIRASHWDGEHSHPLEISVEGVWISEKRLNSLLRHIRSWTKRPADALVIEDLDSVYEIAMQPGQSIQFIFGAREDVCVKRQPVVTIRYEVGRLKGEYHVVTDQSCLTIFVEEASSDLRR